MVNRGGVYTGGEKKKKEPPKEFALPPSNQAMRRVYAYLLQQRHISREVLSAFAQKGLIYESRELSIDQTKCITTPCSSDSMNAALPVMPTSGGSIPKAKSYRGQHRGQ